MLHLRKHEQKNIMQYTIIECATQAENRESRYEVAVANLPYSDCTNFWHPVHSHLVARLQTVACTYTYIYMYVCTRRCAGNATTEKNINGGLSGTPACRRTEGNHILFRFYTCTNIHKHNLRHETQQP